MTSVKNDRPDCEHIRTARTTRSGDVVTSDLFTMMNTRESGKDVLGRPAGHIVLAVDRKPIVTKWGGMEDYDECPPDYGKFFEQYLSYTTHLVWKTGVAQQEIADVVSAIMTRFMERDSLGEFRRDWATRSKTGASVFRSYYSRFVVTYASGMHRNNVRYAKRHYLLCDAPVGEDGRTRWIDQYDSATVESGGLDNYEVEFSALVGSLGERVGADVMSVVTALVEETGRIKLTDLAARLGVSARAAKIAKLRLREAARAVVG